MSTQNSTNTAHVGLLIEKADLKKIDRARKITKHNRSQFFRMACVARAQQIIREASAKRGA